MGLVLAIGASWSGGQVAARQGGVGGSATEIHVKLKDERASVATFGAMAAPLFGELPAGAHDDRARWVRIDVVDASVPKVLEMLRHDPNVEEAFPVNANEAEARRLARFWAHGHSPGPITVHAEPPNPAMPSTLDLRWQPARSDAS